MNDDAITWKRRRKLGYSVRNLVFVRLLQLHQEETSETVPIYAGRDVALLQQWFQKRTDSCKSWFLYRQQEPEPALKKNRVFSINFADRKSRAPNSVCAGVLSASTRQKPTIHHHSPIIPSIHLYSFLPNPNHLHSSTIAACQYVSCLFFFLHFCSLHLQPLDTHTFVLLDTGCCLCDIILFSSWHILLLLITLEDLTQDRLMCYTKNCGMPVLDLLSMFPVKVNGFITSLKATWNSLRPPCIRD
ncbi:hypothetical protein QVD17_00201 [Tagetes erecta]|uniref:Uncharacterized protein n=1 Tax=Tagetes erecta TaxID=13708 RepID=A0AAD8L4L1_TARER|nr:hypothetical protein QVD17_00201 [Tagetes erecta]